MPDPVVAPLVTEPVVAPAVEPTVAPAVTPPVEPKAAVATELGKDPAAEPKPEVKAEAKPDAPAFDAAKLTLPEGFAPDEKLMGSFKDLMTADLPPQERGQKLIELYSGALKQVGEANSKAWTDLNAQWVNEVKADPEIGGAKYDTTKATIAKAIDTLGPKDAASFRQALDVTGAGNNLAVWRAMAKFAKAVTEGQHVGGSPPKDTPDIGATFFPNSNMKA